MSMKRKPLSDTAHPLLALDNAVCTPHIGYVKRDGFEGRVLLENEFLVPGQRVRRDQPLLPDTHRIS